MTYIIETKDYIHIPEHSIYNHNYYRNNHTGEVILEYYEDDYGTYYNLGTNPTFTHEYLKTAVKMWTSDYDHGFSDDVFETDTECS